MSEHSNINPTGSPFDRTLLMMELEKKEIELKEMMQIREMQSLTIVEMSQALRNLSEIISSAMRIKNSDWQEFDSVLLKYGIDMNEPLLGSIAGGLRLAVDEFLRFKLGTACVQKIND